MSSDQKLIAHLPASPHMQRLYGNTLRKDAGVTKTLRNAVRRASHTDGRAGSGKVRKDLIERISKNVREVQGTVEKVFEETADAVEEFINKCDSTFRQNDQAGTEMLTICGRFSLVQLLPRSRAMSKTPRSFSSSPANALSSRAWPTTSPATTRRNTRSLCALQLSRPSSLMPRLRPPRLCGTTSANRFTSSGLHRRITRVGTGSASTASAQTRTLSSPRLARRASGVECTARNGKAIATRVWAEGKLPSTARSRPRSGLAARSSSRARRCRGRLANTSSGTLTNGLSRCKSPRDYPRELTRSRVFHRYHHDGKHSVVAISQPFEVFVDRPTDYEDPESVHTALTHIVSKTLALDAEVVPHAALPLVEEVERAESVFDAADDTEQEQPDTSTRTGSKGKERASAAEAACAAEVPVSPHQRTVPLSDPDDFVLYSTDEATHIAYAIKCAFDVELDKEVVLAAANVGKLAAQLLEARKVLGVKPGDGGTGMKADLSEP